MTLIGLGLVVTGYLLAGSFALLGGRAPDEIDACSVLFGVGCDAALLSPTSWQLGIPLAGWGLVYYGTLVCLLVQAWALGETFELEGALGALLLAIAGALASVTLVVITAAGWAPLCPLCMVIHAINLALVPALKHLSGRTVGQLLQALRAGGKYLLGGQIDAPLEGRWKVMGFVTASLVTVVLYQWMLVESERRVAGAEGAFNPEQVLAAYASTPEQDVPIDADDPRLGPADAPVRLVVFSNFQCPGCRAFSDVMYELVDRFDGKLAIIFKHYPLGTACNASVRVDKHPLACEAAWAAEAARRQGRFWPVHDALFISDLSGGVDGIHRIAGAEGLDPARFERDRRAEATKAKVRSDVELGTRLGVDATPAVFLNGRRVRQVGRQALEVIVDKEVKAVGL